MVIFIAGAGIVLLALCVIWKNEKEATEKQRAYLREHFGKLPEAGNYSQERLAGIRSFYEEERRRLSPKEQAELDEITWTDLSMDEIYKMLNKACSTPGEEYLYYLLRTPCITKGPLEQRQKLIALFLENEGLRYALLEALMASGKMKLGNFYGTLGKTAGFPSASPARHIIQGAGFLAALLFAVAGAACGTSLLLCLPPLAVFMFWNVSSYYKGKAGMEDYYQVAAYVVRLLQGTKRLFAVRKKFGMESVRGELADIFQKLTSAYEALRGFQGKAKYVRSGRDMSGGPADILLDYLRLFTHIDLIQFHSMMQLLKTNREAVEVLYRQTGYLDAMLCAASFTACFPKHSAPVFTGGFGGEDFFSIENMYHPCMKHPVKNSIKTSKGVLLTGSNASGKSTFLKTLAVNVILAQTINMTLSDHYQACFFRPMTSMALKDDLDAGKSYFMVEIQSLLRIINQAEGELSVLGIVDEVLRGTNTTERIASGTQILRYLSKKNIFCLAATHDVELSKLLGDTYENYHFSESVDVSGGLFFDYRLKKGAVSSRNAIRLLCAQGFPEEITKAALKQAERYEKKGSWEEK